MNLTVYTNDEALLAYIDLLGTTDLYKSKEVPLKNVTEVLYSSLLEKFFEDFQNTFKASEIRDHFHVNIYSDSIMICQRKKTINVVDRLTEVLLRFQANLLFNLGNSVRLRDSDYDIPVPSRILMGRGRYFSMALKAYRNRSILGSKFTSVSLCGGHGMVDADNKLKGLPIGLYAHKDILRQSTIQRARKIKAPDNLFFIKQDPDYIDFLLMFPERASLRDLVKEVLDRSLIRGKEAKSKLEQWVSAHEGNLHFIDREE
jgi:hypothetical protein